MKKIAIVIFLILFFTGSSSFISHTQPTSTECRSSMIVDGKQFYRETSVPNAENQDHQREIWDVNVLQDNWENPDLQRDINKEVSSLDDSYQDLEDVECECKPCPDPYPPDGRVYYGSDTGPYAYVLTQNPKIWVNMTLGPPPS